MVRVRLAVAVLAAIALAGCMTSTPVYDKHFGEAVRTVQAMQTLNPDAAKNTDTVAGVDGQQWRISLEITQLHILRRLRFAIR